MRRLSIVAGVMLAFSLGSVHAQESQAAKATRMKLKEKISVDFKETGTASIFKEIAGEMEKPVTFKIDNASGVSNNTKLTYSAKNKSVEEILNEISDKGEFGWVVISNKDNNKVDGNVVIRKSSKGKERGYEAGKEKGSRLEPNAPLIPRSTPTVSARVSANFVAARIE